jgi:hypothetical protein
VETVFSLLLLANSQPDLLVPPKSLDEYHSPDVFPQILLVAFKGQHHSPCVFPQILSIASKGHE